MINGLGNSYAQIVANATYNDTNKVSQKAEAKTIKEPDKLDAIKEAVSNKTYKLDMSKTSEALMKYYS